MDDDVTKRPPALRPPPRIDEGKDPKIALALAIGEERGRVASLEQQVGDLRRELNDVRFAQTRPRHDSLSEIEGAPHLAGSIRVLAHDAPKARKENRLLTIGLAFVAVVAEVILHALSH